MKSEIILTQQTPATAWVAGLRWHTVTRTHQSFPWTLPGFNPNLSWTVYQESNNKIQCGHSTPDLNQIKGSLYSVALALQAQLGNDWIGLFRLTPELVYLIAVKDRLIYPASDKLFDNLAEGITQYVSLKTQFNWENTYTSEGIEVEGEVIDFNLLLLKACRRANAFKLEPPLFSLRAQTGRWKIPLILSSFFLASAAGFCFWLQRPLPPTSQLSFNTKVLKNLPALPKEISMPVDSSSTKIHCLHSWVTCLNNLPATEDGFQLLSATCDPSRLEAIYQIDNQNESYEAIEKKNKIALFLSIRNR